MKKQVIEEIDNIARLILTELGEQYKQDIEKYYKKHKCRLAYQITKINEHISKNNTNILEIGPFPGILSIYYSLKGYNVDVIEYPRPEMKYLEKIYNKYNINVIYYDLASEHELKIEKTYNYVFMFEVIEHIPAYPIKILNKINKLMEDKGILFMSTPNLLSSFNRIAFARGKEAFPLYNFDVETTKGHFREYSKRELLYILDKSGFRIKFIENFDMKDYCRIMGIKFKENTIENVKIQLTRILLKLIGVDNNMKHFFFIIGEKGL